MIILNYGGGTNSTALTVEALNRGLRPDLIVFADTGSERPETYAYLKTFGAWLAERGLQLHITRWIRVMGELKGQFLPLHEWCDLHKSVPSKAFGLSGCTSKWKQQPIDRFVRERPAVVEAHRTGPVERWIGYDADEPERAVRMFEKNPEPRLWTWRAPLVEWDMGRAECVAVIERAGLPLPGKSACWMCPSMTKREILTLRDEHPELLKAALAMEARAIAAGNLAEPGSTRKGLGGRLNWASMLAGEPAAETDCDTACGCFDGGE